MLEFSATTPPSRQTLRRYDLRFVWNSLLSTSIWQMSIDVNAGGRKRALRTRPSLPVNWPECMYGVVCNNTVVDKVASVRSALPSPILSCPVLSRTPHDYRSVLIDWQTDGQNWKFEKSQKSQKSGISGKTGKGENGGKRSKRWSAVAGGIP